MSAQPTIIQLEGSLQITTLHNVVNLDHKPQFREAGVGDLLKIAQFNKDMALVSLLQCCTPFKGISQPSCHLCSPGDRGFGAVRGDSAGMMPGCTAAPDGFRGCPRALSEPSSCRRA